MVHAQSYPSARDGIDAKRIAGNTLALLVHAVALAILMLPSSWEPPLASPRTETLVFEYVKPPDPRPIPIPQPPLPPETRQPRPTPPVAPTTVSQAPVTDTTPVMDTGTEFAIPTDDGAVEDTFDTGAPTLQTLAYDVHPAPRYPRQALRQRLEGTVTLRVLVDEQGWPKEVEVERSSGHRELDRAAREQVLAKWRFHPAQAQGRAVRAYALVPIAFSLP
jgi:protein TonB